MAATSMSLVLGLEELLHGSRLSGAYTHLWLKGELAWYAVRGLQSRGEESCAMTLDLAGPARTHTPIVVHVRPSSGDSSCIAGRQSEQQRRPREAVGVLCFAEVVAYR